MKRKSLKNGFSIPALGMGTWCFGGRDTHDPANDDEAQIHALRCGMEEGFTLIDTAEYYAAGYAETLVGKAAAGVPRDSLFITSKVWKTHLRHDDVLRAAEQSLQRLNTSYFDLYLYHQIDDAVPLEETVGALNELVRRGLTRRIGVSNFALPRLKRAMALSREPIVVNQVNYSLTVREVQTSGLLEFCQENDVIVQAWRPVRGLVPCPLTDALCRKYSCTLHQLALAWLLAQENTVAITAMKNPAHLAENMAACGLVLDRDDVALLMRDMPGQVPSGAVPLK